MIYLFGGTLNLAQSQSVIVADGRSKCATCNCPALIPRNNIEPLIQSRICIHLSRTNHK